MSEMERRLLVNRIAQDRLELLTVLRALVDCIEQHSACWLVARAEIMAARAAIAKAEAP